jgi:hypothetical protein
LALLVGRCGLRIKNMRADLSLDYHVSQELAEIWISEGIDSVVFPSATGSGRNIAVYLANADAGSVVVRNRAEVLAVLRRPRAGKRGP